MKTHVRWGRVSNNAPKKRCIGSFNSHFRLLPPTIVSTPRQHYRTRRQPNPTHRFYSTTQAVKKGKRDIIYQGSPHGINELEIASSTDRPVRHDLVRDRPSYERALTLHAAVPWALNQANPSKHACGSRACFCRLALGCVALPIGALFGRGAKFEAHPSMGRTACLVGSQHILPALWNCWMLCNPLSGHAFSPTLRYRPIVHLHHAQRWCECF